MSTVTLSPTFNAPNLCPVHRHSKIELRKRHLTSYVYQAGNSPDYDFTKQEPCSEYAPSLQRSSPPLLTLLPDRPHHYKSLLRNDSLPTLPSIFCRETRREESKSRFPSTPHTTTNPPNHKPRQMECETQYQRYRKLTLDTSLPATAFPTYSRVGSLENICHNTTVTNSNEGSPICLKCGGPLHSDENLCPSVALLEGYMYAQRQHQNEPRNGGNDGVAKKKKRRRRRPKMLYQIYRPTPPEPQPLIQTKNARKQRRRRARRRLMDEQIRKEKKRQEWIIREARIREEAKTRGETIIRESRRQEEEEQARLMSLEYEPTRVYQSEAYMFINC